MTATLQLMHHLSGAGLTAILNNAWLALAAAAAVGITFRFTQRVSATTRHTAWWAVLAIVIIAPCVPGASRMANTPSILLPERPNFSPDVFSPGPSASLSAGHTEAIRAVTQQQAQPSAAVSPSAGSPVSRPVIRVAPEGRSVFPLALPDGDWPEILVAVWFVVFVLLLARVMRSYLHLPALRKRAWKAPEKVNVRFECCLRLGQIGSKPRLLVSDEILSPLAAGFLRPVVILPDRLLNEISGAELDNVLLHELAHFARKDNWTNLLARLLQCALVLHPVAVWALSGIEREREAACDDWAVAISGSAREYAATLMRLFEVCGARRPELLATGMAYRSSRLGERIELVLRTKRRFVARTSFAGLVFCGAAGLGALAIGAQAPGWIALAKEPSGPMIVFTPARSDSAAVPAASMPPTLRSSLSEPALHVVEKLPAALDIRSSDPQSPISLEEWTAEWTLERSRSSSSNPLRLSFGLRNDGSNWTEQTDVGLSSLRDFSFAMLERDGPVKFEYVREAGELLCEGAARGGRAHGTFTVKPNTEFVSALEKMGYAAPDDRDVVFLMMSDVTLQFAREIKTTGLELTAGDLAELRSHDVTADYIRQARQAGLNQFTAEDFCELRTHGVEPVYLQRIVAADPKLTAEDIAELRTHGVEPEYLRGMQATGVALSMEDISDLRTHGVEPAYLKSIRETDSNLSIDDIKDYRTHGVEPDYLKEMKAADHQLSAENISELRTHGVEPQYLKEIREVASHLSIDEICDLRTHGVEASYLRNIEGVDSHLTADEISDLRTHGVEPEYYKTIKAVDPKLSVDEMTELRTRGVEPEYYKSIQAVDPRLSIDEINELRTHGVEPEYYKEMKTMDPKLSVDEITELRTHGVEPSHLKDLRGAAPNLSIEDLTQLSSHGVPGSLVAEAMHEGYRFTAGELCELWSHGVDARYLRDLQDMGAKNLTAEQILRLRRGS
jgi:beta-lactamase regulating signal transducer with metallopeptidase domain